MTRTRIAVFEGLGRYGFAPRTMPRGMGRRYGFTPRTMPRGMGFAPRTMPRGMGFEPRELPRGMGAPLFNNPRLSAYGRRGYYVPPLYEETGYGPRTSSGRGASRLKRRGYKVKKGRNSKAQVKFKKAAKACSRRRSKRQTFQQCMRKKLKR